MPQRDIIFEIDSLILQAIDLKKKYLQIIRKEELAQIKIDMHRKISEMVVKIELLETELEMLSNNINVNLRE